MRYNDSEIHELFEIKPDLITPKPKFENISGVTVDVHLDNSFRVFDSNKTSFLDLSLKSENLHKSLDGVMREITIDDHQPFILQPKQFALGCTLEKVNIPDFVVAWLDGRSSLARLGLQIHISAHRIDPGFTGQIVLEFFNAGDVALGLRAGMKIGALSFEKLNSACSNPYNKRPDSKYKDQHGPASSKLAGN